MLVLRLSRYESIRPYRSGPRQVLDGPSLSRARRRTHHMDVPHLRCRGVRATAQQTLPSTGRGLCRCGVSPPAPALRANRLAPCQLRVTSFASKSRLLNWHPLYVSAHAAPHVRASRYGLELPMAAKDTTTVPRSLRSGPREPMFFWFRTGVFSATSHVDEERLRPISVSATTLPTMEGDLGRCPP